jgi:hypothetical protein
MMMPTYNANMQNNNAKNYFFIISSGSDRIAIINTTGRERVLFYHHFVFHLSDIHANDCVCVTLESIMNAQILK